MCINIFLIPHTTFWDKNVPEKDERLWPQSNNNPLLTMFETAGGSSAKEKCEWFELL